MQPRGTRSSRLSSSRPACLRRGATALVLCAGVLLAASRSGSLPGTVVDGRTNKPLAGAVVAIAGRSATDTTDSTGAFLLDSVPVGFHDIRVSCPGYLPRLVPTWQVRSGHNRELVLDLEPDEHVQALDRMVVRSDRLIARIATQSTSVLRLSRDEILNAPGANQDIAQVLQSMPSVVGAAHEGFTRLLVRGGDEDENALLVDGIEVNTLSHWGNPYEPGGGVSILHPDYIAAVDFYAGGVPVEYPPMLSAVTDIRFREGSMSNRSWQVDLNTGGFGFFLEGPIVRNRASYLLNARVGVTYLVSEIAGLPGIPEYQNGQTKLVWNMGSADRLVANVLVGHERLLFEEEGTAGEGRHFNEGLNVTGGLQWRRQMDRGENRLLLSAVRNDIEWSDIEAGEYRDAAWRMQRTRVQLKDDLRLFLRESDVLSAGMSIEGLVLDERRVVDAYEVWADTVDSSYRYLGPGADTTGLPWRFQQAVEPVSAADDTLGLRLSGHLGYAARLGRISLGVGVRDDYYTLWGEHGLSPRVSVGVDLGNAGSVSLSGGLYCQPPAKFDQTSDSIALWNRCLQRAWQAAVGYQVQLGAAHVLGYEGYVKYYDREPAYELVASGHPQYPDAGWRYVTLDTDEYSHKRAYGLEVYLQKKKLDLFYYQLSYALTHAEQEYADGEWRRDDNDLRNSASVVLGSNISRNHRISARADISEGYPYTPLDMAASETLRTTVYDISEGWNEHRRPWHVKLNLRYDLTVYLRRTTVALYLEGYNLLNQRDVVYEYMRFGGKWPEMKRVQVLSRSILPGLGLYVTF